MGSGTHTSCRGREALLVKGRLYDVFTCYSAAPVDDYIEAAARQVLQIHCAKPEKDGDILIFMPGQPHPACHLTSLI